MTSCVEPSNDTDNLLLHEDDPLSARKTGLFGRAARPELQRLSETERALFEDLKRNRYDDRVRLEQKRVAYGHLLTALVRFGF